MVQRVEMIGLPEFPMVEPGDDLASLILQAMAVVGLSFESGDLLVIAQKVVSKSEGRYRYLNEVLVTEQARTLASETAKDPRIVQLILEESVEVVRQRPGAIIVEHRNGYVHANAGIDQSNITSSAGQPRVLLLPEDPDASARALRASLQARTGAELAIIINDSAGRAWRNGTLGFAIGTAGLEPVVDMIGQRDLFGRPLEVTTVAVADELAAGASFVMGQAAEGMPVVLVRGARWVPSEAGSSALIRARENDLFR